VLESRTLDLLVLRDEHTLADGPESFRNAMGILTMTAMKATVLVLGRMALTTMQRERRLLDE
jgi:hypothetical protein